MNTVTSSDGTGIAYSTMGTGPALILIDGALCYRGAGPCTPLASLLAPRFTTYTYDRRGRGESRDTAPYAVEREVDDLAALVTLAGDGAHLYGVSSGAMPALLAAERGLPVGRLALFEPPFATGPATGSELHRALAELVAAGRNGDALEHFQLAIGIPPETVAGMRHAPFRAALEAIAPTLVYDTAITASFPLSRLSTIDNPSLVIASADSTDGLHLAAKAAAETLPHGTLAQLPGWFHDVPAEDLAPVLTDFLSG
jgi:alpha-beta hydrolase superfamily lysophospholipase